jgi:hypothetical protein
MAIKFTVDVGPSHLEGFLFPTLYVHMESLYMVHHMKIKKSKNIGMDFFTRVIHDKI